VTVSDQTKVSEIQRINDLISHRLVHEVHTSERRSYRGCRRRWDWVFRHFYYPKVTAKPLEFGVAFHAAMEVLYEPDYWKWDRKVVLAMAQKRFVDICEGQRKKFLQERDEQYISDEEIAEDYDERLELGKGMLKYYAKEVAPKYDKGWTPLKVEVEFIVPIQNPDTKEYLWCKCVRCVKTFLEHMHKVDPDNVYDLVTRFGSSEYQLSVNGQGHLPWDGLPVVLAGRIDLLAEDAYGDLWIVDWKTAARLARGDISGQDHDEFLELDDQIGSYVMALRRKLGLPVRGFVYVELKKSLIQPPQRNKTIRLGRMYSVNQQQAVDFETYRDTVAAEDKEAYEAGLYDEHLEWLKEHGQNYYGRYQIAKTEEELEEIERNLWMEAADMVDPRLRIYPSAGRFNCGGCAFRQPCIEKNRQGDYRYMLDTLYDRRKVHYWAEKPLSTDKQGGE
jgi:hypothetical protein